MSERFRCPCCHCRTLTERAAFELCPVCFWEDEGQDDHNVAEVLGGANGELSLLQARRNYQDFAACSRENVPHVRRARADER